MVLYMWDGTFKVCLMYIVEMAFTRTSSLVCGIFIFKYVKCILSLPPKIVNLHNKIFCACLLLQSYENRFEEVQNEPRIIMRLYTLAWNLFCHFFFEHYYTYSGLISYIFMYGVLLNVECIHSIYAFNCTEWEIESSLQCNTHR